MPLKTLCHICKQVHDPMRHCLSEENDALRARVAELEARIAGAKEALEVINHDFNGTSF